MIFTSRALCLCFCCVSVTQEVALLTHFRCFSSFLVGVKFIWVYRVTSGIPTTAITDTVPTHAPKKLDNYIPDCSLLIAWFPQYAADCFPAWLSHGGGLKGLGKVSGQVIKRDQTEPRCVCVPALKKVCGDDYSNTTNGEDCLDCVLL